VYSSKIAGFNEPDCPGHPAWLAPTERPTDDAPLHLLANQPTTRLHSQLDFGAHSAGAKHRGREIVRIHPADAMARGISDGGIVRIYNRRGSCLAAAWITDDIRRGVVQLPTGAWYDPVDPEEESPLCVHGNPNVLTRDVGTSALAQGCTGQLTTVQVESFNRNIPPIRAYDPPSE
jgi:biotin/methionine sulfoxide reductase